MKASKKSITGMLPVPKQSTFGHTVVNAVVSGRPQEKDWVQVNRRKKSKGKEVLSDASSSCDSHPSPRTA